MKQGQIRKDQIKPFIAQLEASPIQAKADKLNATVPGIAASVRDEIEAIKLAIMAQDYGFAIQSRVSGLLSRLDYAERGLYSRCDGQSWHYA